VRHDHLNGERRHLAGAALVHQVIGLDDLLAATKARADDHREAVRVDLGRARGLPDLATEQLRHPLDVRHAPHVQTSHVVVDGVDEMTADAAGEIPVGDELVLEYADATHPGQQALPRALDVRRDRSRRRDGGYYNAGETAVSTGRLGHLLSAICARMAAAASGFSSSSFWM